jgi:predicted nuclease with TOPRIM domain
MQEQLEQRLQQLKSEFEAGQKMLAELEAREASVRETLLRISGAIKVLEEQLTKADHSPSERSKLAGP